MQRMWRQFQPAEARAPLEPVTKFLAGEWARQHHVVVDGDPVAKTERKPGPSSQIGVCEQPRFIEFTGDR
jgi:hypothetical protein